MLRLSCTDKSVYYWVKVDHENNGGLRSIMDNSSNLFQLQSLDTTISNASIRLKKINAQLNDTSSLDKSLSVLEAIKDGHDKAKGIQRKTERETQRLEERKSQISKKIYSGEITNPRELSAFEDEIANLSDQIENSEDKLLLQMEESDKYDEGLQKASSKHEDAKNKHEILSHKLQAEREQLLALIERDTPVRDTARTLLSSETLRIYDSIRKSREGIAVSSVESNRCSTCRINVPLQIIQKLKSTSEFVYCNSCRRILLMST